MLRSLHSYSDGSQSGSGTTHVVSLPTSRDVISIIYHRCAQRPFSQVELTANTNLQPGEVSLLGGANDVPESSSSPGLFPVYVDVNCSTIPWLLHHDRLSPMISVAKVDPPSSKIFFQVSGHSDGKVANITRTFSLKTCCPHLYLTNGDTLL